MFCRVTELQSKPMTEAEQNWRRSNDVKDVGHMES
jgi:hypothetical protein